jgi:hypothetical protein
MVIKYTYKAFYSQGNPNLILALLNNFYMVIYYDCLQQTRLLPCVWFYLFHIRLSSQSNSF